MTEHVVQVSTIPPERYRHPQFYSEGLLWRGSFPEPCQKCGGVYQGFAKPHFLSCGHHVHWNCIQKKYGEHIVVCPVCTPNPKESDK